MLQKISAIPVLENYINFLINIVTVALKKNLPIETSYSVIYSKNRKNETEATNLAGYDVIFEFSNCIRVSIQWW